jgi:cytochrome c556
VDRLIREGILRFRLYVAAGLVVLTGSIALAQKMTTPEELDKAMKKVQPAMQAAQKALKSEAYADVKPQLATIRQVMVDTREFWVHHKKDDALKANEDVMTKLDAVDKLLSATPVDPAAVVAGMKEMGGACLSCHKLYRERDSENNYILKPGSVGE